MFKEVLHVFGLHFQKKETMFQVVYQYISACETTGLIEAGVFETKKSAVAFVVDQHLQHNVYEEYEFPKIRDWLSQNLVDLAEDEFFESYGTYSLDTDEYDTKEAFRAQNLCNATNGTRFEHWFIRSNTSTLEGTYDTDANGAVSFRSYVLRSRTIQIK